MKKIFLCHFLLIISIFTFSQKVSYQEANLAAQNTIIERFHNLNTDNITYLVDASYIEKFNNTEVFYVFNLKPKGFIIISADKSCEPLLAFSNESSCTKQDRHPAASQWLEMYSKQIENNILNNSIATSETKVKWQQLLVSSDKFIAKNEITSISPLLKTKWDQGTYYNEQCPEDPNGTAGRAVTGCVATALGQLMYYFRHPEKGNGSYGYSHPTYGWLEVDFSQNTYNYDEMSTKPTDSNYEIAELIYNIGVSVDMNYGPQSSGMNNHKGAYTLLNYFDYNSETKYLYKDSLPEDFDWKGTLVNHLNRNIPLYYAGWADYNFISGHAFIFDGYSDSSHYHINWGWGGYLDGYFLIDNLSPGANNFTLAHEVIINAIPNSEPTYCEGIKIINSFDGIIEDGSGPLHNYENNVDCSWLISPDDSITAIQLDFLKFIIDSNDYIIVFDGPSETSPVLGTFYGNDTPYQIQSSSNKILIKFITDSDSVNDGWMISYNSIKPIFCNGTIDLYENTGFITDGSGEFMYHNNSNCRWRVKPTNAQNIKITFLEFDLEDNKDVLKIFNASGGMIFRLTGSEIPEPIIIQGNKTTIGFESNQTIRKGGFKLQYETNVNIVNIESNEISNVSIFPNPANDKINIILKDISGNTELKIISSSGKLYIDKSLNLEENLNIELNISELPTGVYIISIINNKYVKNLKFIKE